MKMCKCSIFCVISMIAPCVCFGVPRTIDMHVDSGLLSYKNLAKYARLSNKTDTIKVVDGKLSDLTRLVENLNEKNLYINGVYNGHVSTSTKIFDETGKKVSNYGWAGLYMRQYTAGTLDDCPSYDASVTYYNNSGGSIGHITGLNLLAPRTTDGKFDVPEACSWMYEDTDGLCRQSRWDSDVDRYAWNPGEIVRCDKTDSHTDGGFAVDLGPVGGTVPSKFNGTFDIDTRLTYEYEHELPSLVPYVNAAKTGRVSGGYTFAGGYVGNNCKITYGNDGKPIIDTSKCTKVYDATGASATQSFSRDLGNKLTFAWDYSAATVDNCSTERLDYTGYYNRTSNIDLQTQYCTPQRALTTTTNSVISPAEDCALLCKDKIGVCYIELISEVSGMVPCDTQGYVSTQTKVLLDENDDEGAATNTTRYRTYLPRYAIRSPHTYIYVQDVNTWPSLSNLVSDLYHCSGSGCPGSDNKEFKGIYTEEDCTGDMLYNASGVFVGPTYTNASEIPSTIYMCWE